MSKKKLGKVVARLPKRKGRPRGKPFLKGNPWRFPQGVSGNPGAKPRKLVESLVMLLALDDPDTKLSYAEILGRKMLEDAINGSTTDRNLIRLITEGETVHTPDMLQVLMDK